MKIDPALRYVGKELLLFDGRNWEKDAQSDFFRLHLLDGQNGEWLNKSGDYLVWKLPSSEVKPGRIKGIGIRWSADGPNSFLIEIENFNVER